MMMMMITVAISFIVFVSNIFVDSYWQIYWPDECVMAANRLGGREFTIRGMSRTRAV